MAKKPTVAKKPAAQPTAMLIVGNQPGTLEAASNALVAVLAAATQEGAQIAACNALAAIAHAPGTTNITSNSFVSGKP
jgi:hypothetical protein